MPVTMCTRPVREATRPKSRGPLSTPSPTSRGISKRSTSCAMCRTSIRARPTRFSARSKSRCLLCKASKSTRATDTTPTPYPALRPLRQPNKAGLAAPRYTENSPMSNIQITLPDGGKQSVASGTRPIDIAKAIGSRLADAAIVAKVDGELYDLTRPIEKDASLQILTAKDPESLVVYRHSTAHLLAAAVLELYPDSKLGIGPPIDTGFYR